MDRGLGAAHTWRGLAHRSRERKHFAGSAFSSQAGTSVPAATPGHTAQARSAGHRRSVTPETGGRGRRDTAARGGPFYGWETLSTQPSPQSGVSGRLLGESQCLLLVSLIARLQQARLVSSSALSPRAAERCPGQVTEDTSQRSERLQVRVCGSDTGQMPRGRHGQVQGVESLPPAVGSSDPQSRCHARDPCHLAALVSGWHV